VHLWYSTGDEKWVLDQTGIFAQVDAFVQRCRDLLEVSDDHYVFLVFTRRDYRLNTHIFFENSRRCYV